MDIRELREKSIKAQHEARALLGTIKDDGSNEAEVNAKFQEIMTEADRFEARAKKIEDLDAREAAYNAADPRAPREDATVENRGDPDQNEVRAKAFGDYLRTGVASRELRTAQSVGTASTGGYTVPTNLSNQLVEALKYFGPMNEGSSGAKWLITADGAPLNIPTMDDTSNAGSLVAENTDAGSENLTFAQKALPVYKYKSGTFLVSNELLQDSAIDIVQEVNDAMSERLGRIINTHLTTGDASGKPQGIVTGASAGVTAAAVAAVTADELISLVHQLDPAYRAKARWQMNDSTVMAVRKLKDSQNRYLFEPSLQAGQPGTLLGYAFDINNDIAAMAAGTDSIIFGDPSRYYARRAGGFAIRRLDERFATLDQVGFVAFVRIGGVVVTSGAIKKLTMAAS